MSRYWKLVRYQAKVGDVISRVDSVVALSGPRIMGSKRESVISIFVLGESSD